VQNIDQAVAIAAASEFAMVSSGKVRTLATHVLQAPHVDGDSGDAAGEVLGAGTNGRLALAVLDTFAGVASDCTASASTSTVTASGLLAFHAAYSASATCSVTVQLCDAPATSRSGVHPDTAGLKAQLFSVALPVLVMVRVQVR
jgi:hypothetical protein